MIKKFFITILSFAFFITAVSAADIWDDFAGAEQSFGDQKPVTNQEFEDAINVLQEKQKKKEARQKRRKIRKISGGGTSLHNGLEPTAEINAQDILKDKTDEGRLLNVPVNLVIDNNLLEKGYYNIFSEKDKDNKIFITFYQSQYLKGKVPAQETKDDCNSEEIDFVKLIPCDNNIVKVVYGSLEYNAYAYIRYYDDNE